MRLARILVATTIIASSSVVVASVPAVNPNFQPSSRTINGPQILRFSGFCIELKAGESATFVQVSQWANATTADLAEGTLSVKETGAGYSTGLGMPFRKVNGGTLRKSFADGNHIYFFDNGLPGSTVISFVSRRGSRKLDPVLSRFDFSSSC